LPAWPSTMLRWAMSTPWRTNCRDFLHLGKLRFVWLNDLVNLLHRLVESTTD
jgi:hypothetical protein